MRHTALTAIFWILINKKFDFDNKERCKNKSKARQTLGQSKARILTTKLHNSSAVADMGDCLAAIDMGRKLGAVPPFLEGAGESELGPI